MLARVGRGGTNRGYAYGRGGSATTDGGLRYAYPPYAGWFIIVRYRNVSHIGALHNAGKF